MRTTNIRVSDFRAYLLVINKDFDNGAQKFETPNSPGIKRQRTAIYTYTTINTKIYLWD